MSFIKVEQVEGCLEDSSAKTQDTDHQILSKNMDFIDPNVLETRNWGANELMQLFPDIKPRINFLKQLQLEAANIEGNFFGEVHALECKYCRLYAPLYEKRRQIVAGSYEPRDQGAQWPSGKEDENLENQQNYEVKMDKGEDSETDDEPEPTGLPNFWLTIFKNVNFLFEIVQPQDEHLLSYLQDIRVNCSKHPLSITLFFHFSSNDYFTNSVLTKKYFLKCESNKKNLFNFEGPEIYKSKGCIINWIKDMNLTLKTAITRERHKRLDVVRTVIRTVENKSFFNFFTPSKIPENSKEEEIDNNLPQLLDFDFEVGLYIKEKIVPKAVLLK